MHFNTIRPPVPPRAKTPDDYLCVVCGIGYYMHSGDDARCGHCDTMRRSPQPAHGGKDAIQMGSSREWRPDGRILTTVQPADLIMPLSKLPQIDCPLTHRFTPGLYVREIFMPRGALIISKKHKTEHPFVISKGRVRVWTADDGVRDLAAPYCGVTKPGTQRALLIIEDCVWTTFHPGTETDLGKLEELLIAPAELPPPSAISQLLEGI